MNIVAADFSIPLSARTKTELQTWAQKGSNSAQFIELAPVHKQVLVILADVGSGLTRENIYVYTYEKDQWHLVLVRFTSTKVRVELGKEDIVFYAPDGMILLKQPIASIQSFATYEKAGRTPTSGKTPQQNAEK